MKKIMAMAYEGDWEPVFTQLAKEIKAQTSIRDYLKGEQTVKAFLAAYISVTDHFIVHLERELNKSFADLYLEPFWEKNKKVKYGYLIEIKYVPMGKRLTKKLKEELKKRAREQLLSYAEDERIKKKFKGRKESLKLIYQLWKGWRLIEMEEVNRL